MKYLAAFYGKTIGTAIMVLCLLNTKTSPTAVPSLLTSLLVVDGMKIVGSEKENKQIKKDKIEKIL